MTAASLTPDEVEVFARGLHYLATQDGVNPREEALIREFLDEAPGELRYEDLESRPFDPIDAAQILSATYLRRIFVKAAMILVHSDGHFSPRERDALGEIADAFGISNSEYGEIERAALASSFEALSPR